MAAPSDADVYCAPSDRPARSVHWVDGVFSRVLRPRVLKFDPACVDSPICAPLNPPRETSHGDVPSVARVVASRGMSLPPKPSPLSVVLF